MPNNILQYSEKLSKKLDDRFIHDSVTGIFEGPSEDFEFLDDRTVRVAEVYMSGLADYDRDLGFVRGSVASLSNIYQLSMERGRSFMNDRLTAQEAMVKNALDMARFQKEYVAPEVDAYALSKIGYFANNNGNVKSETLSNENALTNIQLAMNDVQQVVGYTTPLIIFVSSSTWGKVRTSKEYSKTIDISDFTKGDITTKVRSIDQVPIIPVQDKLMYSKYQFLNGVDSGQEPGGFVVGTGAVKYNYIIVPRNAPKLITKTAKIRVFSPDQNQRADAWQMDYRRTYDLLCTAEKQKGIVASAPSN